jgi:CheY-like chemotaxis protein
MDSPGTRSILVVDDNRDLADCQAFLLKVAGYQVAVAYDGHDAVDAALAVRPDVVLLDIGLPGIDGYEVADHLRGEPRASRPAFDHRLMKPVTSGELPAFLRSAYRSGPGAT